MKLYITEIENENNCVAIIEGGNEYQIEQYANKNFDSNCFFWSYQKDQSWNFENAERIVL